MFWYDDLHSSLDDKDAQIELRNQIIEDQSNRIYEVEATNEKLTRMYGSEQRYRFRYESQIAIMAEEAEQYRAEAVRARG